LSVTIGLYSDRSRDYKIVSILCLLPTAILQFPHTLLPDPTNIIDISVHIAGGLTIFIILTNFKYIQEEKRDLFAMFGVIGFIVALEVFQIILKLTADIGGPITLDVLEDIFLTIGGGLIGLIVTRISIKNDKEHPPISQEPSNKKKKNTTVSGVSKRLLHPASQN
jgi:glycopeptide antibiotics resistance protein